MSSFYIVAKIYSLFMWLRVASTVLLLKADIRKGHTSLSESLKAILLDAIQLDSIQTTLEYFLRVFDETMQIRLILDSNEEPTWSWFACLESSLLK